MNIKGDDNLSANLITGIIPAKDKSVLFSLEPKDHRICFLTDDKSFPDSPPMITIKTEDGFIWGKTHDGADIAIYAGKKDFEFIQKCTFSSNLYILSFPHIEDNNYIEEFDSIKFEGGTINSVLKRDGLGIFKRDSAYESQKIEYDFDIFGEKTKILIAPYTKLEEKEHGSVYKKYAAYIELRFSKPQRLSSLTTHFEKIQDLLSFMTYRLDVGFDSVSISRHITVDDETRYEYDSKLGEALFQYDYIPKNNTSAITFEDLSDALPELLNVLYQTKERKPTYIFGFLPDNQDKIYRMNNNKLRLLCSSIESELSFRKDIKTENNVLLNELISQTKKVVEDFKKNNPDVLDGKTYSMISSSMKHWSFSLDEKICALYDIYRNEIQTLKCCDAYIDENDIHNLVKYRNDITHGSYRVMDVEIARTAEKLMGLVYCCLLERIGMKREKIFWLCCDKILQYH